MNDHDSTHDNFERRLSAELHAITDGLEPAVALNADDLTVIDRETTGSRRWAKAGSIGLVAAVTLGVIAIAADQPGPTNPITTVGPSGSNPSSATAVASTDPASSASEPGNSPAEFAATNILVVGTDNGSCTTDPSLTPGIGDRTSIGERTDTIIVARLDPANQTAALLSFPRDLWVPIAGRNASSRLNTAFVLDDPNALIQTIGDNFGIGVDHYVQIDMCAFARIVDAVGGVTIPFDTAVRDTMTGFAVPEAGCVTLDGDHALAYVRSRRLEYLDTAGVWQTDPRSDLGRIDRQQDFIRRTIHAALDAGITDTGIARALITSLQDDIVIDNNLTLATMLDYLGFIQTLDPAAIAGYQIEGTGGLIAGNAVLIPTLDTPTMQQALAVFGSIDATSDPNSTNPPGPSTSNPPNDQQGYQPPPDIQC